MTKTILFLLIFSAVYCSKALAQHDHYLMSAKKYGKWGFINLDGAWIIDNKYEEVYYFTEGLAAVKYYGKWGFINRHGQWIIQPDYSDAKPFSEGVACVISKFNWGYINKKGQWHFEPNLKVVSSFSDGNAIIKGDDGFVFINRDGNYILPHSFEQGLPFSEGLAYVVYNGFKGYIGRNGNWLIKHDYEEAYSFSERLALIKTGNKYGFIDQKGSLVIPAEFDDANYFMEGLAAVKRHEKWGYINHTGQFVIDEQFEAAFPFSNDHAVVKSGGKYGLIDKKGKWVLNPIYSGLGRYTKALSLEEQVQNYVFSMYSDWQLKGEFEKTSAYLERVSQENREAQIRSFTLDAINSLAKRYVRFDQATVGLYEADYEKFNVFVPGAKSILLPVPLEFAKEVKDDWDKVWLGNPAYTISGDEFLINSLEVRYKDQVFYYHIAQDYHVRANSTLDLNFNDFIYDIPKINGRIAEGPLTEPLTVIGQSDVDVDIPFTNRQNSRTFALIIGNEDYSSFQMDLNTDMNVDFATVDATTFKKYLVSTLGVPNENITLLTNATAGQMRQSIARLSAISEAFEGEARLIFYYAGHGLPREGSNEPYLIPVDVSSSNLDYAIKLEDVYKKLTEHQSETVTVFLDACFTGGARNQSLVASRGVRIKPKSPFVLGNLIVFSASSEDQTAHPYREKAHGIFTYYLLKALQISNGEMSYGELADFVRTNVMRKSVLVNDRVQIPQVEVSPVFEYTWKDMRFLENSSVAE
ncbi:MAG: WG repeat-containing protein [Candidatus Cyclobacteriaceae bacterium M3_2C_046]